MGTAVGSEAAIFEQPERAARRHLGPERAPGAQGERRRIGPEALRAARRGRGWRVCPTLAGAQRGTGQPRKGARGPRPPRPYSTSFGSLPWVRLGEGGGVLAALLLPSPAAGEGIRGRGAKGHAPRL